MSGAPFPTTDRRVLRGHVRTWSASIPRRHDEVGVVVIFNQVDDYDALTERLTTLIDTLDEGDWMPTAGVLPDEEPGNEDPDREPAFKLFPNPRQGATLVSFTPRAAGSITFVVFNIRGQRLRQFETEAAAGSPVFWEWVGKEEK